MAGWRESFKSLYHEPANSIIMATGPHFGDASWATTYFPCLTKAHPGSKIIICCQPRLGDAFAHNPYVRRVIITDSTRDAMLTVAKAAESKRFAATVPMVPAYPLIHAMNIPRYQVYLKKRGYDTPSDLSPDLRYSGEEIDRLVTFMAQYQGGPKLLLEPFCYSGQSAFTLTWYERLAKYLLNKYPTAWLFVSCAPTETNQLPPLPRVITLEQFTIRQSGFILNFCDGFIGVGSGVGNACSGLAIKRNVLWIETTVNAWHSTIPYGRNRRHYLGKDWDEYFAVVQDELTNLNYTSLTCYQV
jgi:hypothetical protein